MQERSETPTMHDDDLIQTARERYSYARQADDIDRKEAEEDVAFVGGDQWREEARKQREARKLPVLQWNRLQTFVAQVTNDGRENKPSIHATAMDGGKRETAEMFEGRIRHIEYECDADIAYDTAREHQVVSGRGFYRVRTEYAPSSFKQKIRIEPIENQFSVLFDPAARKYDKSDADWCFVSTEFSRDAYQRKFGRTAAVNANFFADAQNPAPEWIGTGANGEMIHVAEYWLKEHKKRTLCLLADISVAYEDELPADIDEAHILDRREEDCIEVHQYIIDGVEVLAHTEWIGSYIPIIPVYGKQMVVKGRPRTYSLVRFAKDPQRLVNLYVSNIAQKIAEMPKAPYLAAAGQIDGFEADWEAINEDPKAVILYNPVDANGTAVGPPQRIQGEPPIQALTVGLNQAIDAIKAAMGIFDAALGANSNETSGIAIQRRRKESDVANFHFPDNEARSRKHLGRILLELIPKIDKGAGEVATRGRDGKTELVPIGKPYADKKTGATVQHDIDQGSYDVAISTGPSYTSQRQEANDAYASIAASDKNFMSFAGDLYFRTSDMPGADQIADRYEKMLPAALKPQDPNGQQQAAQQVQQLTQQVQQLQQANQQAHQFAQSLHEQIQTKAAEVQARVQIAQAQEQTRLRIVEMQEETKRAIANAQINFQRGAALLESETEAISTRHDMIAAAASQHAAQEHAAAMQQGDQQHAAAMQVDQQQAQAEQQQAQAAQAQQGPPIQPGHAVTIRGKKMIVSKVHPDGSFDGRRAA